MQQEFEALRIERRGATAAVQMMWPDGRIERFRKFHTEFPIALQQLRDDDTVRVVVLRGCGERFLSAVGQERPDPLGAPKSAVLSDPMNTYRAIRETAEILDTIVSMEKPVIAMVNGDALGIGLSVALHCDLIIAREDVLITDLHMAIDRFTAGLPPTGVVPGDGGTVILPLQMSLAKAKEFLFLGKPVTAKQLAQMNAINAAVPAGDLESVVEGYVKDLLERPAWALAWTKVAINKRLKQHLTLFQDVAMALETVSMRAAQAKLEGGKGITHL
jgi:enoyl-CoA hydratase/carnithine racemase